MKQIKLRHRHHFLRPKYKRYAAAALAGAVLLTGAALPGISSAKASAAPASVPAAAVTQTQIDQNRDRSDHNGPPGRDWHQHRHSWPGSDDNQAWYQDGRIYYRNNSSDSAVYYNYTSPVDFVRNNAAAYGFDSYRDNFTLLTVTSNHAVVQVTRNDTGKMFNVILDRTGDHDWTVARINAI